MGGANDMPEVLQDDVLVEVYMCLCFKWLGSNAIYSIDPTDVHSTLKLYNSTQIYRCFYSKMFRVIPILEYSKILEFLE
jgi:hypothetical protein